MSRATAAKPRVELLVNPFCMEDAHVGEARKICEEFDVPLTVYNPWDIDDAGLDAIPEHVAALLREVRAGLRPGSVYGNLFVNGERLYLNFGEWPEKAREMIAGAMKERSDD
jgi:hypothetical protein